MMERIAWFGNLWNVSRKQSRNFNNV